MRKSALALLLGSTVVFADGHAEAAVLAFDQ